MTLLRVCETMMFPEVKGFLGIEENPCIIIFLELQGMIE